MEPVVTYAREPEHCQYHAEVLSVHGCPKVRPRHDTKEISTVATMLDYVTHEGGSGVQTVLTSRVPRGCFPFHRAINGWRRCHREWALMRLSLLAAPRSSWPCAINVNSYGPTGMSVHGERALRLSWPLRL